MRIFLFELQGPDAAIHAAVMYSSCFHSGVLLTPGVLWWRQVESSTKGKCHRTHCHSHGGQTKGFWWLINQKGTGKPVVIAQSAPSPSLLCLALRTGQSRCCCWGVWTRERKKNVKASDLHSAGISWVIDRSVLPDNGNNLSLRNSVWDLYGHFVLIYPDSWINSLLLRHQLVVDRTFCHHVLDFQVWQYLKEHWSFGLAMEQCCSAAKTTRLWKSQNGNEQFSEAYSFSFLSFETRSVKLNDHSRSLFVCNA